MAAFLVVNEHGMLFSKGLFDRFIYICESPYVVLELLSP